MAGFSDHFSSVASQYAKYRPTYPDELFKNLAHYCRGHKKALDIGTGNGQAACQLAKYFESVVATDASEAQIAHAFPHPQVKYRVEKAEEYTEGDENYDLVCVATALHWFDFDAFYRKVRQVAKGGVIAAWSHDLLRTDDEAIDRLLNKYHEHVLAYWPPERRYIQNGYRDIPWPFGKVFEGQPDVIWEHRSEVYWTAEDTMNYLYTWSATDRFIKAKDTDPLQIIRAELKHAWGPGKRLVYFPIMLLLGSIQLESI